jgi:hypothetical protein
MHTCQEAAAETIIGASAKHQLTPSGVATLLLPLLTQLLQPLSACLPPAVLLLPAHVLPQP